MGLLRHLQLGFYDHYCDLLYPLYRDVTVGQLHLLIESRRVMHPFASTESLLPPDLCGKSVLEIGTGCGIVALTAKRLGASYVLGIDIDEAAVANAETNLKLNFPGTNGIEFRCCDLYESIEGKFDLIVSNPPYFTDAPAGPSQYKYCGGDMVRRMLSHAKMYLKPSGEVRVLYPAAAQARMNGLASEFGYTLEVHEHVAGRDCLWLRIALGRTLRRRLKAYHFRAC